MKPHPSYKQFKFGAKLSYFPLLPPLQLQTDNTRLQMFSLYDGNDFFIDCLLMSMLTLSQYHPTHHMIASFKWLLSLCHPTHYMLTTNY